MVQRWIPVTLALAAASGCGSSSSSDPDAAVGGDGPGSRDAATGACHGAGFAGGEPVVHVAVVSGTLVDLTSAPIVGAPVAISGTDLAQTGLTGAGGSFSVAINHDLKRPAFKFGDGLTDARLAVPVTTGSPSLSVVDARLPATGAALAAGTSVTSGELTLAVPAGATILIDELSYDTPDKQRLRAVTIPVARLASILPPALGLQLVVGVAPVETSICPPATLTLPNAAGWPAGAAIEVYGLESDVGQEWAPFGQWGKLSDGQVSADGQRLTAPLAVLETIAIRRAP